MGALGAAKLQRRAVANMPASKLGWPGSRCCVSAVARPRKARCGAVQGCDVWEAAQAKSQEPKEASATEVLLALFENKAPADVQAVEFIARGTLAATPTPARARAQLPASDAVHEEPSIVHEAAGDSVAAKHTTEPENNEEEEQNDTTEASAVVAEATVAPTKARKKVSFDLDANAVIEITPYSEVYGIHPRFFDFDRDFWMVPSRGPPSPALAQEAADEHEDNSDSDDEDDYWYDIEELRVAVGTSMPAVQQPEHIARHVPMKAPAEELCLLLS
mmetsp:Transcript_31478/g.80233  ORF Transcript_31478/g.80233 Transcript_31478/m.80233 type:complete len:275 (+) Transcript_31478:80-904(+)